MSAADGVKTSLWEATAVPAPPTPALEGDVEADAAIVGAGYCGLSAALHLAESGMSTVVLDAGEPGAGASGRSGGQVIAGLKQDPAELIRLFGPDLGSRLVRLVGGAPDLVFSLIERHGIACDAVRSGWIQPAYTDRGLALAERRAAAWSREGADVAVLDRSEIERLTGSQAYRGGWIDRRGGTVQPLSYVRGLASAALRQGASVHGNSRVLSLARERDRWRLRTARGTVSARHVVLATNAYSDDLWPGLRQSIVPVYSFQVATRPLGDNVGRTILPDGQSASDTRRVLFYFRRDAHGRLVMGGRGPFREQPGPSEAGRLYRAVAEIFPQLGQPDYEFHWAGRIAMTTDSLPHLHEPAPGLHAALGCNGRGVAMGTVLGRVLARRVSGTPAQDLDFPVTGIRKVPFHAFAPVGARATIAYYRVRDWWEART